MKNRKLWILLTIVLIAALGLSTAMAKEDFHYRILEDGTVEITNYLGKDESLAIPETLDGKTVTSIGGLTFLYQDSLKSVTIPNSVTYIGENAFLGFSSLTSMTIPESVTSIGENAFLHSDNLTLTVFRDSYAAQYAKDNGLSYTYPDSNDWLNN